MYMCVWLQLDKSTIYEDTLHLKVFMELFDWY